MKNAFPVSAKLSRVSPDTGFPLKKKKKLFIRCETLRSCSSFQNARHRHRDEEGTSAAWARPVLPRDGQKPVVCSFEFYKH